MKYSLVRQFSNNAIDNFFKFFYKIADFGRECVQLFWAFLEIWEAFFLIFFNMLMYVYYFFLFIIDKSTESQSTVYFWRKLPQRVPYMPQKVFSKDSYNPVPAMYGRQVIGAAAEKAASAAGAAKVAVSAAGDAVGAAAARISKAPSGAKVPVFKRIGEFVVSLFGSIGSFISSPFRKIGQAVGRKIKPAEEEPIRGKSLIDQYMKEYEKRKKI